MASVLLAVMIFQFANVVIRELPGASDFKNAEGVLLISTQGSRNENPWAEMQLRVTRPAFIEGVRVLKASQGIQNYDVNKQATRQEMRAYVCGQCHDEYHFSGPEKRLVYPWAKGLLVENILAFYDEQKFKDWEHAETGAPVLKAQHPEFEMCQ